MLRSPPGKRYLPLANLIKAIFHCRIFRIYQGGACTSQCRTISSNSGSPWKYSRKSTFYNDCYTRRCNFKTFSQRNSYCTDCPNNTKSGYKNDFCIDKPIRWPSGKRAAFKFHEETEDVLNKQINAEFKAFYYYLSMVAYFGRVDVALPGCESFFTQMHHEEHEHALRFLNYVKMRGGCVNLCRINPPSDQNWKCPLHAFKTALELEIEVTDRLVNVNTVAEKHGDLNASDFVITGFMEDQMRSVNEMGRFVAILSGIGDQSLARFLFDKDLLDNYVEPKFNVLKTKLNVRDK